MTKRKDNLRDLFTLRDFVLGKYLTRSREEEGKTTKFFYSSLLSLRTGALSFAVIARFIRAIYGSHAFAGAKRVMTREGRGVKRVMTRGRAWRSVFCRHPGLPKADPGFMPETSLVGTNAGSSPA